MNDVSTINAAEQDTARDAFRAGALECLTLIPSYIPFGMVCGVAAMQAGLGELGAIALAAFAFAGSSQAILTQFLASGAPLAIAVLSGLVVNLRMAVYSAAISPRIASATKRERLLWAAFLVDQTFLSNEARHQRGAFKAHPLAFFLGTSAVLWPAWIITNALGAFLGAQLPPSWQLEFTIPLSFVAMMVPILKNRAQIASAVAGATAGVLLFALPLKLGLIAACVLGTCFGLLVDAVFLARQRRDPNSSEKGGAS
jgi:predicted branched-subunit amino acid permease